MVNMTRNSIKNTYSELTYDRFTLATTQIASATFGAFMKEATRCSRTTYPKPSANRNDRIHFDEKQEIEDEEKAHHETYPLLKFTKLETFKENFLLVVGRFGPTS